MFEQNLHRNFMDSVLKYPLRPAVELIGTQYSYRSLYDKAVTIAATLSRTRATGHQSLTGICTTRSEIAYSGVLGALMAGHGYVPLNPEFPASRNAALIRNTNCSQIIADEAGEQHLRAILDEVPHQLVLLLPNRSTGDDLRSRWPRHKILTAGDLRPDGEWRPSRVDPDSIAYILFTSGSTGQPKGVVVTHRAASSMIESLSERYHLDETDRLSQFAELSWDPSVVDMFLAWRHGACVCCPHKKHVLDPDRFIRDAQLTMIHIVPSIAVGMKRLGRLKEGRYPCLRYALLGGEPLPAHIAESLAAAAPGAAIDNIYGATEYCIFSAYRWDRSRSSHECDRGWTPIGEPLRGGKARVVSEDLEEVAPGAEGQLLISGPQLFNRYWEDPERTRASIVSIPHDGGDTFYKMGDIVKRSGAGRPLCFVGRRDQQIKINGARVELGEIELAIREEAHTDTVAALGWPPTPTGFAGVVAFLAESRVDPGELQLRLKARLPNYMVPRTITILHQFPKNANGKNDRLALRRLLEEAHSSRQL